MSNKQLNIDASPRCYSQILIYKNKALVENDTKTKYKWIHISIIKQILLSKKIDCSKSEKKKKKKNEEEEEEEEGCVCVEVRTCMRNHKNRIETKNTNTQVCNTDLCFLLSSFSHANHPYSSHKILSKTLSENSHRLHSSSNFIGLYIRVCVCVSTQFGIIT